MVRIPEILFKLKRTDLYFFGAIFIVYIICLGLVNITPGFLHNFLNSFSAAGELKDYSSALSIVSNYFYISLMFVVFNYIILRLFRLEADISDKLERMNLWVFITSALLGLYLYLHMSYYLGYVTVSRYATFYYTEDGLFENLTAVLFLTAALIMVFMVIKMIKSGNHRTNRLIFLAFLCVFIGCFFIGMEEISWGQRIIGFETPKSLAELNVQDEVNLHNLIRTDLPVMHISLIVSVFLMQMVSVWLSFHKKSKRIWRIILPHPSSFPLICLSLIAFVIFTSYHHEMVEELVALLAMFYAIRAYRISRLGLLENEQINLNQEQI